MLLILHLLNMDYNNLKKGSIIYFPFTDENVEVLGINAFSIKNGKISNNISVRSNNNLYCEKIEVFSPIPLSVEWLKKAGYKQLKCVNKTYSLGDFEDNSAIFVSGNKFTHINTGTKLDYVHEWQNLYSAIFKKELKFYLT